MVQFLQLPFPCWIFFQIQKNSNCILFLIMHPLSREERNLIVSIQTEILPPLSGLAIALTGAAADGWIFSLYSAHLNFWFFRDGNSQGGHREWNDLWATDFLSLINSLFFAETLSEATDYSACKILWMCNKKNPGKLWSNFRLLRLYLTSMSHLTSY